MITTKKQYTNVRNALASLIEAESKRTEFVPSRYNVTYKNEPATSGKLYNMQIAYAGMRQSPTKDDYLRADAACIAWHIEPSKGK